MTMPETDFVVQVTAKQFNWQVVYPGADGKFGTADDKLLLDEMHVPVNKVIRVLLKSQDVIHSFFVPQFRMKQDAVPGREIKQWFEATKPGKYSVEVWHETLGKQTKEVEVKAGQTAKVAIEMKK